MGYDLEFAQTKFVSRSTKMNVRNDLGNQFSQN